MPMYSADGGVTLEGETVIPAKERLTLRGTIRMGTKATTFADVCALYASTECAFDDALLELGDGFDWHHTTWHPEDGIIFWDASGAMNDAQRDFIKQQGFERARLRRKGADKSEAV
jgi:hypothetical protein